MIPRSNTKLLTPHATYFTHTTVPRSCPTVASYEMSTLFTTRNRGRGQVRPLSPWGTEYSSDTYYLIATVMKTPSRSVWDNYVPHPERLLRLILSVPLLDNASVAETMGMYGYVSDIQSQPDLKECSVWWWQEVEGYMLNGQYTYFQERKTLERSRLAVRNGFWSHE